MTRIVKSPEKKLASHKPTMSEIKEQPTKLTDTRPVRKVKEIIQNTLNLINGIAFGSHKDRFRNPYPTRKVNISPGPGQYEVVKANKKPFISSEAMKSSERLDHKQKNSKKSPGPGSYFNEVPSLIKRSYNITLPQNAIMKQKENVLNIRAKSWLD